MMTPTASHCANPLSTPRALLRIYPFVKPVLGQLSLGALSALIASLLALGIPLMLDASVLVLSTALRAAGPALIAYGLNSALPAAVSQTHWMPTIAVVAIYLITAIGGAALIGWYVVVAARLTQAIMLDLRQRIFRHTQRLSLEFHESYTSGRITSRQPSDLDTISELLDGGLNQLVSGVLYVRNFFSPLQEIAVFLNSYQAATAALEKVSGVLEELPTVPDLTRPIDLWTSRGHVHFDGVEFGCSSGRTILPDFTLDMPSERQIQDALQTLLADRTAIIIAHRLSTVAIADRVLVMEHGVIIEDDVPASRATGGSRR